MHNIIVALLMGAAAMAQPTAVPRKPSVSGRVLRPNGDPVRATVTLIGRGSGRYSMSAAANGEFLFEGVAPGTYSLIAQRPGYASVKYGAPAPLALHCIRVDDATFEHTHAFGGADAVAAFRDCIGGAPGMALTVTPNTEIKGLTIRIAQTGVIRGKVTDQDSDAVNGSVAALLRNPGEREFRTATSASVQSDGSYTLDDLAPGRYYVLASPSGNRVGISVSSQGAMLMLASQDQGAKAPSESEISTYYPNAPDARTAVPVEVKAGEELRGVDILMRRAQVFSVRGSLVLPAGTPAANASLTLAAREGIANAYASPKPDGTFEFRGVAPGAYVLSCQTQGGLSGRLELAVAGADLDGLKVPMAAATPIAGTLKMEGAPPAAWPTLTLTGVNRALDVTLKVEANGTFQMPLSASPIECELRIADLPPGVYVKSIRFAGQENPRGRIDIGGAGGNLEILLATGAATLTGKVNNAAGDASPGALVTAWPRTAGDNRVKSASTDQNGEFEIEGLAPGDYFIAAWEEIPSGLVEDTSFLGRFQTAMTSATLESNGHASAVVKLIPREKMNAEIEKLR